MIDKITHNGTVIAIIVYKNEVPEGIQFITPKDFQLQLGMMGHKKGYKIKPHIHHQVERNTKGTYEVLFIRKGVIRMNFYYFDQTYLETRVLSAGDIILLVGAGHGITVLEDADIVEVKNGPHVAELDKMKFEDVDVDTHTADKPISTFTK